jgi:1,4-dihydroxy-2-naphthoate octaprenyltransferase
MNLQMIGVWLQAARLPSQSYIFLPLFLGQSMYFFLNGSLHLGQFILIQLFGVFNQLYIVFANDYADIETDKLNDTYTIFSGGSRVLANGKLAPHSLRNGAILMASLCVGVSIILCYLNDSLTPLLLSIVALALLQFYSFSPLKLSYRGGGEYLQMLGVGLVLPLYGFLGQNARISDFPWEWIPILFAANLSCAIATSLPDVISDKKSDKRTIAVTKGSAKAKLTLLGLEIFAMLGLAYLVSLQHAGIKEIIVYLIPLLMIVLSLVGLTAKPGEFRLSIFVFFSIAFNLSLQGTLLFKYFRLIS